MVIIGAGFAGIGLGALLRRAGIGSFTILEKSADLGGTWRDNTYPGAACDVPSHLYCYSFAPKADWSRRHAPGPEILAYLRDVAVAEGVAPHIRYGCEVAAAEWSEEQTEWTVTLSDGRTIPADVVVSAVGQLHRPAVPELPGADSFVGPAFHSARWPADLSLTGRRVGVVGSAASAVQIVPAIATESESVTVFQRSPNWILRRGDRPYRGWEKRAFATVPLVRRAHRGWIWASYEVRFPALRDRRLFVAAARRLLDRHLVEEVPIDDRARLTPDFPVGARRVLSADDYYPALRRDDVHLETAGIARVLPDGVELIDGRFVPLDVLVYATGFRSTEFLVPMTVKSRGRELSEEWREGARAYLGLSVPGFPNFFVMYGPNTNLGHNSIVFMLEAQARHIVRVLADVAHGDEVEVSRDAFDRQDRALRRDLARTVWGQVERSWYKTDAGRITNNWGAGTPRYWWLTRRGARSAYRQRRRMTEPIT